MSEEKQEWGSRLIREDKSTELAMNHGTIHANVRRIRDHNALTDKEAATLRQEHTAMITGAFRPQDVSDVHGTITQALTKHPPISQLDKDAKQLAIEKQRVRSVEVIREEFGWQADKIIAKMKTIVDGKPALQKLLKETGLQNDPRIILPLARQAKLLLEREARARRK